MDSLTLALVGVLGILALIYLGLLLLICASDTERKFDQTLKELNPRDLP
jgi:hypothetical protein